MAIEGLTLECGVWEQMEEKGWKKEMEKMVEERREFPKEEFSGFR